MMIDFTPGSTTPVDPWGCDTGLKTTSIWISLPALTFHCKNGDTGVPTWYGVRVLSCRWKLLFIGLVGEFLLPPVTISRYSTSQNMPPPGNESVIWPAAGAVRESVRLADSPSQSEPKSSCAGEYWGPLLIGAGATPGFSLGGVGVGDGTGRGAMAGAAVCGEAAGLVARGLTLLGAEACGAAATRP